MMILVYADEPTLPALIAARQFLMNGNCSTVTVRKQLADITKSIEVYFDTDGKAIPTITERWEFFNSAIELPTVQEGG
jgi:hypothetical protein